MNAPDGGESDEEADELDPDRAKANEGDSDLARKTKQLANQLLEALDRPEDDPELVAARAEKEARDKASIEAYQRAAGLRPPDPTVRARSLAEMQFAASLEPCPHCQTRQVPTYELVGDADAWSLTGRCPRCQQPRSSSFQTHGDPRGSTVAPGHLGGDEPSTVLRPGPLIAELDRTLPQVPAGAAGLELAHRQALVATTERALTCTLELLKFIPPRTQMIPDSKLTVDERKDRAARRERYSRAWLTAERDRLRALRDTLTKA